MSESRMLCEIIKKKALEMFNNDYDVLYQRIKNEPVENGLTVRQLLLKYFEDEAILTEIETKRPTLTIFVPELPEDSFSAETWDTEWQRPAVAIRAKHYNTPVISEFGFFNANSDEFVVEAGYVPTFPLVVLKDNERVAVAKNTRSLRSDVISNSNDFEFEFIDECFDGSQKEVTLRESVSIFDIDPKVTTAYSIYQNTDGWQRDYIYYGLTPDNTTGPFMYEYEERIKSFKFSSTENPQHILAKISDDTRDPHLSPLVFTYGPYPWTDGFFEFKITVNVARKNHPDMLLIKRFTASLQELFEISYERYRLGISITKVIGFKEKALNLPLMSWDIGDFSTAMKISVSEEDPGGQTQETMETTVEFAGNIGFDVGWGTDVKAGLKFGASAKKTNRINFTRTVQTGNDELGDVWVNFGDKVILSANRTPVYPPFGIPSAITSMNITPSRQLIPLFYNTLSYNVKEYDSGLYTITILPTKIQ